MDDECRRMSAWIQDVKDSCDKDKKYMEECMSELLKEKEARVPEVRGAPDRTTHVSTERSDGSSTKWDTTIHTPTDPVVEGGGVERSETITPFTEGVPCSASYGRNNDYLPASTGRGYGCSCLCYCCTATSYLTTLHWRRNRQQMRRLL